MLYRFAMAILILAALPVADACAQAAKSSGDEDFGQRLEEARQRASEIVESAEVAMVDGLRGNLRFVEQWVSQFGEVRFVVEGTPEYGEALPKLEKGCALEGTYALVQYELPGRIFICRFALDLLNREQLAQTLIHEGVHLVGVRDENETESAAQYLVRKGGGKPAFQFEKQDDASTFLFRARELTGRKIRRKNLLTQWSTRSELDFFYLDRSTGLYDLSPYSSGRSHGRRKKARAGESWNVAGIFRHTDVKFKLVME
jgi:hypothetical protein